MTIRQGIVRFHPGSPSTAVRSAGVVGGLPASLALGLWACRLQAWEGCSQEVSVHRII